MIKEAAIYSIIYILYIYSSYNFIIILYIICWRSKILAFLSTCPSRPQGKLPGRKLEGGPCPLPLRWRGARAPTETGPAGSVQREAGWKQSDACREEPGKQVDYR